ncbi:ferrochelatase [Leucobacter luti]|uniref:Coproporphyrin III ferrochelatase n=1 Tax=Leucobacter luti TaxID=340320 RepID=A0A4V6MCK3_9MICO|nr:ferrochelatase [Leucobacter luti]MBL3698047.1 ferrochelatase [Leucobacter luti]RZT64869.1 ferrochelatase [Leucobacter luti]
MTEKALPYDALLLCSFGGPNAAEDVIPFLRNVTTGKGIPEERLAEVGQHYHRFGGRSPINEQNLALVTALQEELARREISLPVVWGNRNWHPYTVDTLRDASAFGAGRILTLVTSAYASYSGSRQYREHLAAAVTELGDRAPEIDILRPFFNDPGFVAANLAAIEEAGATLEGGIAGAHIVYVTHSIPDTMQDASAVTGPGYREQHEDVRATLNAALAERHGEQFASSLAYCSRSGNPATPWLEPDVNDHIEALAAAGVTKIVISPIGFISDHMEVAFDLDVEALETAAEHGVAAVRAGTVGTRPEFVGGLVDMIVERAARERGEATAPVTAGELGAFPDVAPPGSCRMRHGEVTGHPVLAGPHD